MPRRGRTVPMHRHHRRHTLPLEHRKHKPHRGVARTHRKHNAAPRGVLLHESSNGTVHGEDGTHTHRRPHGSGDNAHLHALPQQLGTKHNAAQRTAYGVLRHGGSVSGCKEAIGNNHSQRRRAAVHSQLVPTHRHSLRHHHRSLLLHLLPSRRNEAHTAARRRLRRHHLHHRHGDMEPHGLLHLPV